MQIPLWIACPAVIVLSAVDAAIEVQARAVGALMRAVIRRMDTGIPAQPSDRQARIVQSPGFTWHPRGAPMDYAEEAQTECGTHGPRIDAGDPTVC